MNARRRSSKRNGWPENLYQKADGYFWYRNPNTNKSKGLGHDRMEAFEQARQANAALATMSKSSLVEWVTGNKQPCLRDWIPEYKDLWIKREKPAKSTKTAVTDFLKYIAKADFAAMQLLDITAQHISTFIEKAEQERTGNIAVLLRIRLSDIFRTAETKGLIKVGTNPVTVTYVPDVDVKRDRLSLEQFIAIRSAAPTWLANAMNLALVTGQRREDITLMKFEDVREGWLHVVQGKSQGETKLRIHTGIRLEAAAMSIDDAVRKCRDNVVSKFMVHHSKTQRTHKAGDQLAPAGLTRAFATARVKAKISVAKGKTPPTFHEIRSLAERLYKAEYGAEFAQNLLGHKNAKTTAIYDDLRGSSWKEVSAS